MVTCTITTLRTGRHVQVTLELKGLKKGVATLVASVTSSTTDYDLTNNSLSLSTTIK